MEVTFGTFIETDQIKANLYGIGGSTKTTTVSEYPEEWGTAVYIASDHTSPRMKSIRPERRKNLFRIVPNGYTKRKIDVNPATPPDEAQQIVNTFWKEEAFDMAQRDWKRWLGKKGESITDKEARMAWDAAVERLGVYIWDGMTQTGDYLIRENAKKHYFIKDGGPTSGPKAPEIDFGRKVAIPDQGDFYMVQSTVNELVEQWMQQPGHCLITFQEAVQKNDAAKHRDLLFGPCSVGSAGPRQLPNRADINLYLTRERTERNPQGFTQVQLVQLDYHVAGSKSSKIKEAIKEPYKIIPPEPEAVQSFWRWIQALGKGE